MRLLFNESLSPKLVLLLRDVFPESESALENGLARAGDRRILEYAASSDFTLISTDRDFERLLTQIPGANCRPSPLLRLSDCGCCRGASAQRNPIAELPSSGDHLIILDQ